MSTILYEVADGVATITLNKPDKLNALDDAGVDVCTLQVSTVCELDPSTGCTVLSSGYVCCEPGGPLSLPRSAHSVVSSREAQRPSRLLARCFRDC